MESINNIEIYNSLNNEAKEYIKYFLSWIDYLTSNQLSLPIKENNEIVNEFYIEDEEDIKVISSFLALLSFKNDLSDTFKKYNISVDSITKFCKEKIIHPKDATETISFDNIDLTNILNSVINKVSYTNKIEKGKINIQDITYWQIFDYILNTTTLETIEDLLYSEIGLDDGLFASVPFNEYHNLITIFNKDFLSLCGIDSSRNENDVRVIRIEDVDLTYDNGDVFLNFIDNSPYKYIEVIDNNRKNIKIYDGSLIYKINEKAITKEVFDEFVSNVVNLSIIGLTIGNPITGELDSFHCYKENMFDFDDEEDLNSDYSLKSLGNDITYQSFIKNPAIGREKELDEIETILLYPEKDRSIIITGPAGTGKSSLIKGICYRIQNENINSKLNDIRLINLDITDCVSKTKYAGVLEEKLKSIINETKKDKKIIICIEEIHRAMGAGKTEGDDNSVAQILKQYLDCGDIRIIGTTTDEEYREYIEVDTAFKSRFERIDIKEPEESVVFEIINDLIESYNKLSDTPKLDMPLEERRILISKLIEATRDNCRHYQDKENNPRLLINIIKKAYALANFEESDSVTVDHIISSYKSNPRLYKESRESYAKIIKNFLRNKDNIKKEHVVLEFKKRQKR